MRRRNSEAALRHAERRRREDDAPRLAASVPALRSLRIELQERRSGISTTEAAHVKHVVIESAPALFILPCQDPRCTDGGHDVTSVVLRGLQAGMTRLEGEDACNGLVGSTVCQRVLRYVAVAEYRSSLQATD
ncbi:MAG TPA: hypothetical protein VI072_31045 [Polyangiaceae bacterium]